MAAPHFGHLICRHGSPARRGAFSPQAGQTHSPAGPPRRPPLRPSRPLPQAGPGPPAPLADMVSLRPRNLSRRPLRPGMLKTLSRSTCARAATAIFRSRCCSRRCWPFSPISTTRTLRAASKTGEIRPCQCGTAILMTLRPARRKARSRRGCENGARHSRQGAPGRASRCADCKRGRSSALQCATEDPGLKLVQATLADPILDSINEGVFAVDTCWRITSFNRAAERITGVRRQEPICRLYSGTERARSSRRATSSKTSAAAARRCGACSRLCPTSPTPAARC